MYFNDFSCQVEQFISSAGLNIQKELPFIHIPDKKIIFHIVPIHHCPDAFYFQELSIGYERRGIQVIHVWEDMWHTKKELVKSRILALLGFVESIHARKTKVVRIDKIMLDKFLLEHHLHGSPQVKHKYGLFFQKQLMAVASFSDARPMLREGVLYRSVELVRFANRTGYRVVGGLGKLLAAFIEENRPGDLMSYADRDWSCGKSYEKLGFSFIENTGPQIFWVHPDTRERIYAHRLPADMTEEKLTEEGYVRIYNAGNKKYIKRLM